MSQKSKEVNSLGTLSTCLLQSRGHVSATLDDLSTPLLRSLMKLLRQTLFLFQIPACGNFISISGKISDNNET